VLDVVKHTLHFIGTFFLNLELLAGRKDVSQGDMKDGAVLGRVDVLSGKHGYKSPSTGDVDRILLDYSKNLITSEIFDQLLALAKEAKVEAFFESAKRSLSLRSLCCESYSCCSFCQLEYSGRG
jgi:hypothetical protein